MTTKLHFRYRAKVSFEIDLRGSLIVIGGESSSGKTLLCTAIREAKLMAKMSHLDDTMLARCKVFDSHNTEGITLDQIKNLKGYLIVIDNADIILRGQDDIVEYINKDTDNYYIIMSRGNIDIRVTPNYRADIARCNDGVYRLQYLANIPGWRSE